MNRRLAALFLIIAALCAFAGCRSVKADVDSRDPDERRLGALALEGRRDADSVRRLVSLLADKDDMVREAALTTLSMLSLPESYQHIQPMFKDGSAYVRIAACKAMTRIRNAESVPELIIVAKGDASAAVRREAVAALSSFCDRKSAVETLIELVDDVEPSVAFASHVALTRISGGASVAQNRKSWEAWLEKNPIQRQ